MKNIFELKHPVLSHKLGFLRDENTNSHEFRSILAEISYYLAAEATRDLKVSRETIKTPLGETEVDRIVDPPIIVSIMRSGNGMLDACLRYLPFCSAGYIGIYRDKFINNTVEYYFKLPSDVKGKEILLLDPLLATGDTIISSLDRLKQYEVGKIKILTVLTNKYGTDRVHHFHPDVDIYTLSANETLNDKGYLVPGLGDVGDRLFKTK